jgi:hypothetical protein
MTLVKNKSNVIVLLMLLQSITNVVKPFQSQHVFGDTDGVGVFVAVDVGVGVCVLVTVCVIVGVGVGVQQLQLAKLAIKLHIGGALH